MERLGGKDLFDLLEYSFTIADLLDMTEQVLDAIRFLHVNNIIHKDIKPENIRLIHERRGGSMFKTVLYDYGLSEFIGDPERVKFTGTIEFMAPELYSTADYNEKVDLWSYGATLYSMITGLVPHEAINITDTTKYHQLTDSDMVTISQVLLKVCESKLLYEICMDMIELNPENRPSAEALLVAINLTKTTY